MNPTTIPHPDQINWDNLTPDARWALKHVAHPLLEGEDLTAVASDTGLTRHEVTAALERLKHELTHQASTTTGITAAFTRPLALVIAATDLEAARWEAAARAQSLPLEDWIHQLANQAAA